MLIRMASLQQLVKPTLVFSGLVLLWGCGNPQNDGDLKLPFPESRYEQARHCGILLRIMMDGLKEQAEDTMIVNAARKMVSGAICASLPKCNQRDCIKSQTA